MPHEPTIKRQIDRKARVFGDVNKNDSGPTHQGGPPNGQLCAVDRLWKSVAQVSPELYHRNLTFYKMP